jgi:hypothetical protein
VELHAFGGELIERWRFDVGVAVGADVGVAMVVAEEEEDVGFVGGGEKITAEKITAEDAEERGEEGEGGFGGHGFKVQGSKFKVQGSRFKVQSSKFKVRVRDQRSERSSLKFFHYDGVVGLL